MSCGFEDQIANALKVGAATVAIGALSWALVGEKRRESTEKREWEREKEARREAAKK